MNAGFYKNILFCTDFSANADRAFDFAIETARCHQGCALTLLHVLPEPEAQFWKTYLYEIEGVDQKAKADIDAKIDAAYRPRIPEGIAFRADFRIGNPAQAIVDYATENHCDLIVLGRQGTGSIFFGNVATRVARHAHCPVLIIPVENQAR
ncbi:MAG: universal stress protein [Kiritimatiellaeota bacterium]|nr:universal stress protein [Kiritimatiellota bacterium]